MAFVWNYVFWASPAENMQNHLEISSKNKFWTQNMQKSTNSQKSDMFGPAKTCPGGQVLTANQRKYFSRNYTFPLVEQQIYHFIKSYVLLNKFIIVCKIMCFTKQICRRQILIAKPCCYLYVFRFYAFYFS